MYIHSLAFALYRLSHSTALYHFTIRTSRFAPDQLLPRQSTTLPQITQLMSNRSGSWSSTRKWGRLGSKKGDDEEEKKRELRKLRFQNTQPDNDKFHQYGFVSRGDESQLQTSEKAQKEYFEWILETFRKLDAESPETAPSPSTASSVGSMDHVLVSLRKLREALLQRTPDDFTKKVHLFSIRVSSAVGHYQTYVPSINYLLEHPETQLSATEKREIVTLLVLHVSHCNGDNSRAMRIFHEHLEPSQNTRLFDTLTAWTLGDYHRWMQRYHSESDHSMFAIMSMGVDRMVGHLVGCFSASFFSYKKSDFEQYMPKAMEWEQFKEKYKVDWEVSDGMITVRRRGKAK